MRALSFASVQSPQVLASHQAVVATSWLTVRSLCDRFCPGECLNFNLSMPGGATAVALAAQQGNTAALQEMLRFRGENAVSDALLNKVTEDGSTPLTLAMYGALCGWHQEEEEVRCLAARAVRRVHFGPQRCSFQVSDNLGRHLDTLDVLSAVVDVNATNEYGIAPLLSAVHLSDEPVLARLLRGKVCMHSTLPAHLWSQRRL